MPPLYEVPLSQRRHLRLPGSDFQKGDVIVDAGSLLPPQRLIGVAAAISQKLKYFVSLGVAILCCGDEWQSQERNAVGR